MLGGNQICPLAAIRKAPEVITDGSQAPGPAAPGLPPNADSRAHAVATSCVVMFAHEPAFGDAAAGPSCRTLWDGST